jgi:hypothetical protein
LLSAAESLEELTDWKVEAFQMKRLSLIFFFTLTVVFSHGQDWTDLIPPDPPKNSKENTKMLFGGFALQAVGVGMTAASVYFILDSPEDQYEIGYTGITTGLGVAMAGTVMIIASSHNIITVRRSMHEIKKAKKQQKISFLIEPTRYGIGLVCRF